MGNVFAIIKSERFLTIAEKVCTIAATAIGLAVSSIKEKNARKELESELTNSITEKVLLKLEETKKQKSKKKKIES